jgi:serine/threonine-protein kinase
MSDELGAGTVVRDYRIDAVLGQGGMGTVYRATHLPSGTVVALKLMRRDATENPTHVRRFRREAKACSVIRHPNIVSIVELFEHDGLPAIAQEYVEGSTLAQLLERRGALPLAELAPLMLQVTSAVGTAHAFGIVHRDLKPENVLLRPVAAGLDVRVLDFGIAKLTASDGPAAESMALTRQGALLGTPFYMSPEQAFGMPGIDQRADVWSLGIMIYQCLSGVLPTFGRSFGQVFRHVVSTPFVRLAELCPTLPAELSALVMRMLARSPDERPWDLREVHTLLGRHAGATAPHLEPAVQGAWHDAPEDGSLR